MSGTNILGINPVKMNLKAILFFFLIVAGFTACNESENDDTTSTKKTQQKGTPDDGRGAEYEAYISEIDNSDSLTIANTLYYTKENGESYQVYVKLNEESELVRIEEKYTTSSSGSLLTNYYYYKDGEKYATKEHYILGMGPDEKFVERVSYYENGKPKISKSRKAQYEEYLENETFEIIKEWDCSDERPMRALKREGEFVTNFVSVVREDPAIYVIVGEGVEDGYVSALVVQSITPLINKMISNPDAMKGTPLEVSFTEIHESSGFTFQALLGIQIVE